MLTCSVKHLLDLIDYIGVKVFANFILFKFLKCERFTFTWFQLSCEIFYFWKIDSILKGSLEPWSNW